MDTCPNYLLYKKYGLRLAISMSIIGLAIMIAVSTIFTGAGLFFNIPEDDIYYNATSILSRVISFFFLFAFGAYFKLIPEIGFSFKGFWKAFTEAYVGWAIAIAFLVDNLTMNFALGNKINFTLVLLYIVTNLSVGLFEEMLSRGITMNILKRKIKSRNLVILIQAIIFMALHTINYVMGMMTLKQLRTQLIFTFFMGLYYGYIYEKTNSFWLVVLLHSIYDFCVSSAYCFDPTGEAGVIYAKATFSIAIYAALFLLLFASMKFLAKSLRDLKKYKEELKLENYE